MGVVDGLCVSNFVGKDALVSSFFTALGNGIWLALAAGEVVCLFVSFYFFRKYRPRYNY